ncbi:MAG: polysaccharide pyruvyl transferase family protein, partial [Floccifex sp.]
MKKVYLTAYIGDNLGDDLFLDILARRYNETVFSIYTLQKSEAKLPANICFVMSTKERKYIYVLKQIDAVVNKVWPHFNLADKYIEKRKKTLISQSDCVVYIIGSGFMEQGSVLESNAFYESHPYVLGCNFGPYESQTFYDKCHNHFAMASDVCFRDSYSKRLFPDLPNVRSAMDVVFNYEGEAVVPVSALFENYVLISVMNIEKDKNNAALNRQYIEFIKKCIQELLKKDKKIVLFGF